MGRTVLAIDDSLTIRELVCFVLGNAGYDVFLAEDGVEGLERLDALKPELVITDVNMPRLDGLGFIEKARGMEAGKAVPILVLTTETEADKKTRARAAGATGWIVKPFNPNQLLETVRRILP